MTISLKQYIVSFHFDIYIYCNHWVIIYQFQLLLSIPILSHRRPLYSSSMWRPVFSVWQSPHDDHHCLDYRGILSRPLRCPIGFATLTATSLWLRNITCPIQSEFTNGSIWKDQVLHIRHIIERWERLFIIIGIWTYSFHHYGLVIAFQWDP